MRPVNKIDIHIKPLSENKFLINSKSVHQKIEDYCGFDIDRASLKDFNPPAVEHMLNKDKRVLNAEVFFDKQGALHVNIVQREPIVRIETTYFDDFYLDTEGEVIPAENATAIRVPVATGNIDEYKPGYKTELRNSLKDVYNVAIGVYEDPFLRSLIEQIHVDEMEEVILVPKLGRSKVMIGSAISLDTKFEKLRLYYKKGVKRVGLDRFSEINLSYENQIVGVK